MEGKPKDVQTGKEIFFSNCIICHYQGKNIIIPEKNLKKETLEANGMNTVNAITYQVLNGKNGMPAFGGRLNETEIEQVANYVLEQSKINFQEIEN
jgi:cytochrome c6